MKPSDTRYQGNAGRLASSEPGSSSTNEGPSKTRLPVGGPRIQPGYGHGGQGYGNENYDPELSHVPPPTPSPTSPILTNPYVTKSDDKVNDLIQWINFGMVYRVVGGVTAVPHSWPWQDRVN
jgi:hypothetical protein